MAEEGRELFETEDKNFVKNRGFGDFVGGKEFLVGEEREKREGRGE